MSSWSIAVNDKTPFVIKSKFRFFFKTINDKEINYD